jgi:hypothetical protein
VAEAAYSKKPAGWIDRKSYTMLLNVGVGALLFLLTTAIHTEGMLLAMHRLKVHAKGRGRFWKRRRLYLVATVVNLMFVVSLLEIAAWAATYLVTGAVKGIEKALYFSTVTFTTLGYGDIVLGEHWRLLAAFEAANGIIMFGWTTAIVIATVQRVYFDKK